jgi:hypothetical protein
MIFIKGLSSEVDQGRSWALLHSKPLGQFSKRLIIILSISAQHHRALFTVHLEYFAQSDRERGINIDKRKNWDFILECSCYFNFWVRA